MTKRLRVQVQAGAAGEFSSPGSTFCADSVYFSVHFTLMLLQWHITDSGCFASNASGML